jgi:hypothetical protein
MSYAIEIFFEPPILSSRQDVIHAHVSSEPLENINKVLDELRASAYTGRKVVIPHPTA